MRQRIIAALGITVLAATGLTACGDDSGSGGGGGDKIVIGVKFDQPGLGLKEGAKNTGMDVDVAKYVAKELGYAEDKIEFKESPSAQRETLLQNGQVKMILATYSITDARKEKVLPTTLNLPWLAAWAAKPARIVLSVVTASIAPPASASTHFE